MTSSNILYLQRQADQTANIGPFTVDGIYRDVTGWTVTLWITPSADVSPITGTSYAGTLTGSLTTGFSSAFSIPKTDVPSIARKWWTVFGVSPAGKQSLLGAGPISIEAAPRGPSPLSDTTINALGVHIANPTGAHAASAISLAAIVGLAATDVQGAITALVASIKAAPTLAQVSGLYVPLPAPVQKLTLGPSTINTVGYTALDLSSAVPPGALAAAIGLRYRDTTANVIVDIRTRGVTAGGTQGDGSVFHGNLIVTSYQYYQLVVPMPGDNSRNLEYKITAGGAVTDLYIDVQGYYSGPLG